MNKVAEKAWKNTLTTFILIAYAYLNGQKWKEKKNNAKILLAWRLFIIIAKDNNI